MPRRKRGSKYKIPDLQDIKVGDSIVVPKPEIEGRWYSRFYEMARYIGIRVSVQTIDDSTVRLTRVE